MKLTLRQIATKDLPFLKKVYRSTREFELNKTNWPEEQKNQFIEFQFNAQHSYYSNAYDGADFNIILDNNIPVGRLYIWRTENQIRIMDIALLPENQKKGLEQKF